MEFTVELVSGIAVVTIPVTALDAANTEAFKHSMGPVLDAHSKVLLNLTMLRFIDSSGLGAFLSCLRKMNEKRSDLKMCCMSNQVRAVFELMRLYRMLEVYGTSEEALRTFQV